MKFSTKTTYGLRAMIFLARQSKKEKGKSTPISLIAEKEKISNKYLERLFSKLKKDKLIISEKGAGGGYILSRPANTITVYDIIKTLEGKITPFYCLDESGKVHCDIKCDCGVVSVLGKVQKAVVNTLRDIKLSDLI